MMFKVFKERYAAYSKAVNSSRAFPGEDGWKLVERRLLWSLHTAAPSALTKCAKVVGHCMGNHHPHGDQSIYGSLVGLIGNGFAAGHGNFGHADTAVPDPPAAMRYTECMSAPLFEELVMAHARHFTMVQPDPAYDSEPETLPTPLPGCIAGAAMSKCLGVGYSAVIPAYSVADLVSRLEWLVGGKRGPEPVIAPLSGGCKMEASKETLSELLRTGKGKVRMVPSVVVTDKNEVTVKSVPPVGGRMKSALRALKDEIENLKSVGWRDASARKFEVVFVGLKLDKTPVAAIRDKLLKSISTSVSYSCNVFVTGKTTPSLVPPDTLLMWAYERYMDLRRRSMLAKIAAAEAGIEEREIVLLIRKPLKEWFSGSDFEPVAVSEALSAKVGKPAAAIKAVLDKWTTSRILQATTDTTGAKKALAELRATLARLPEVVWKDCYERLRSAGSMCREPDKTAAPPKAKQTVKGLVV